MKAKKQIKNHKAHQVITKSLIDNFVVYTREMQILDGEIAREKSVIQQTRPLINEDTKRALAREMAKQIRFWGWERIKDTPATRAFKFPERYRESDQQKDESVIQVDVNHSHNLNLLDPTSSYSSV